MVYSKELGEALQQRLSSISAETKSKWKLTPDQRHLCRRLNLELPFLPVDTNEEIQLFGNLAVTHYNTHGANSDLDYDQMAIDWCNSIDGIAIFPKLPVYLKNYAPRMKAKLFIKDSLVHFTDKEKQLYHVMASTSSLIKTSPRNLSLMKNSQNSSISDSDGESDSNSNSDDSNSKRGGGGGGGGHIDMHTTPFFIIQKPSSKVLSNTDNTSELESVNTCRIVSAPADSGDCQTKKKYKAREGTAPRTCAHCRFVCGEPDRAAICVGRIGGKICPYKVATTARATDDALSMPS